MATKRVNQSGVWEHMERVSERKVQCRLCGRMLTYGNSRSTSSLIHHLRAMHPDVTFIISSSTKDHLMAASFDVGSQQPCGRQEKISELLLNAALANTLSPTIVESKEFQELLLFIEPTYKLPSEETMAVWLENTKLNICPESSEVSIRKMERI